VVEKHVVGLESQVFANGMILRLRLSALLGATFTMALSSNQALNFTQIHISGRFENFTTHETPPPSMGGGVLTLHAGDTVGKHVDVLPARTHSPLRRVSPHYSSFALDNAFIRDPTGISGVPLPQDATNSTRIDFQDELLNTVMPLLKGSYIRIGGTYTDFVHYYVPGTNYTRCPYKNVSHKYCHSYPCCLPLTMQRWKEGLVWAHRNGLRATFNLNVLHGRYDNYSAHIREPEWWERAAHTCHAR
jgi:hypothetical protein